MMIEYFKYSILTRHKDTFCRLIGFLAHRNEKKGRKENKSMTAQSERERKKKIPKESLGTQHLISEGKKMDTSKNT